MARRLTCGACGEEWSRHAVFCGRCGEILLVANRPRVPRRRLLRLVTPVMLGMLVVTALVATAITRERLPDAASDVELPEPTDVATPGRDGVNTAPRCRVDTLVTSCDLWTSAVTYEGPDPVIGRGYVLAVSGTDLVGVRAEDGRLFWRVTLPSPVIWIFTADEDDAHALVVTEDQTLHVVDVQSGNIAVSLRDVRPVFPGIIDGRIAVIRSGATEVVSIDTGRVLHRVARNSGGTSGRLVSGGFVSWTDDAVEVRTGEDLTEDVWSVPSDQAVMDVTGDGDLIVLVLDNGTLVGLDMVRRDLLWTAPSAGPVITRPLLVAGRVVVTREDLADGAAVTALDAATGGSVCTWPTSPETELRLDPSDDGRLLSIAQGERGLVVAARSPCGDTDWFQELPGSTQPVIASGDRLLTSGTDGSSLLDLPTGSVLWTFGEGRTEAVSARTPIVGDGGMLFRLNGSGLS